MSADSLQEMARAVIEGDDEAVVKLTRSALDAGLPVDQIIDDGMMQGMGCMRMAQGMGQMMSRNR